MAEIRTAIVPSLASIPDETLDEITADGHAFASLEWYRMLEALDLPTLVGGRVELSFVVATVDNVPVSVCPLLRARGEGIYFIYSLRRYFFEHWIEEAVRMHPQKREHFARLFAAVTRYRSFLEWTGSSLDDCLVVVNALSYRTDIPIAPSSPVPRGDVYRAMVGAMQRHARRQRLPIWFLCVEGEQSRLGAALKDSGCSRVFLFHDNRIDLESFECFDDYLQSFRRTTRRAFLRDIKRTANAGIDFEFVDRFGEHSVDFTRLYTTTYSKYGESFFRQPPRFWEKLAEHLGARTEAIIARHEDRLVGFSVLLKSDRRGEMWTYRIGRTNEGPVDGVPYYFGLSLYGPIERAIQLGYRRLWLGPASYEAKSVRGAKQVPLYSYFWFPRRWDRWFLTPYLHLFGKISREQIAEAVARPLRLEESAAKKHPAD